LLSKTDLHTTCPWKGEASYYSINLDSECFILCRWSGDEGTDEIAETELKNSAWYYPEPKEKAKHIKDYVAFCECSCFMSDGLLLPVCIPYV
jgi:uncharacterized protein (DUF427 family)